MKNRIALSVAILSLALLALAEIAPAANIVPDPPHDKGNGILCITCHANHQDLGGTGYNNICLNCHRPGFPKGGAKPLTEADIANPFRTFTSARLGTVFQTSHGWATPDTLPAAGAQPPVQAAMTTNTLRARTAGQLACVRCHNQHSNVNGKFLRVANDQDQLCLDCHRSRNTPSHIQGTHPVGVDYAASAAANPGLFTRLSSNSPVILKGGKVLCSSCHGVHYTDSRAATPSAANFNNLSTSDGLLLRVPLHGATVAAGQPDTGNICVSCHAGKLNHNRIGQNVQCGDCHGGHVDPGDGTVPNVWLVNRQMLFSSAVQSAKNTPVFFQATTVKNYKDATGNGVCQVCHPVPLGAGFQSFHNVADTTGCNNCHTHSNTFGSFSVSPGQVCNACHGYPPRANHAGGPDGYAVFNGITPSPFTNESSSGHATHAMSPYQKACSECHNGNSHDTGTFTDVFLNTNGIIATTGGLTPTYDAATFTCSTVYCHSDGAPRTVTTVNPPTTTAPPAWNTGRFVITGQPNPVRCGSCHQPAATLATNSHPRHLNSSGYTYTCAVCHAATVAGADFATTVIANPALHANGLKDVGFGGLAAGGAWTAGTATCTTVYCHSTVQNAANGSATGVTFRSPVWGNAASVVGCSACHVDMATDTAGTGSHKTHAQSPYVYTCAFCHGSGYTSTTITPTTHANGSIELAFTGTPLTGGATPSYYGGNAQAPGTGFQYCQNVYCHSTVQNATNGTGTGVVYRNPTWGNAASVGTCGGCHVNMAVDAVGSGSHYLHANGGANGKYPCATCHNGAGKDPNTLVATPRHVNGQVNISFSGTAAGATYARAGFGQFSSIVAGSGYGACSGALCHGGGTPTWGNNTATSTCDKCHTSAGGLPFKTTAGVTANTDTKAGAHTLHLNAAGTTNPLPPATKPAMSRNLACTDCHVAVATVNQGGHFDTPGPAAVVFGTLAQSGGLVPTYAPATGVCTNTYCHGNSLPSATGVVRSPVWNTPFLTGTSTDCATCHGYPPPTNVHTGVVATGCAGCHPHVNASGTGFADVTLHINGNIDAATGCTTCHGLPPVDLATLVSPSIGALSAGNAGAHQPHVNNPNIGLTCSVCHNGSSVQMPSTTMEMGFNAFGGRVTTGTFTGYSTLINDVYVSTSTGTIVRRTNNTAIRNTCSVYCHGAGGNGRPAIGGGSYSNANRSPNWEAGASQAICGTCHGVSTTSAPTAGNHGRHALSTGTGLALGCDTCHGTVSDNRHVDGSVAWHLKGSDPRIGAAARYRNLTSGTTGALAPSVIFGSCNNLYCHSNVQGSGGAGAPTAFAAPAWGGSPLTCASCHQDMSTDPAATGSHTLHANTTGNGRYPCATCHNGGGSGTTLHANAVINLSFSTPPVLTPPAVQGTVYALGTGVTPGTSYAGATCSNTTCHGGGTPVWGSNTATATCDKCHTVATALPFKSTAGVTTNTDTKAGAHTLHLNAASTTNPLPPVTKPAMSSNLACTDCHTAVATVNQAGHLDTVGSAAISFGTLAKTGGLFPAYTPATGVCTNTYCHGNTLSAATTAVRSPSWTSPILTGVASNDCGKCHGYPPATATHTGVGPTNCVGCHSHVNATGTGFTDLTKHIDGFIEAAGGDCTTCHSTTQGIGRRVVVGPNGVSGGDFALASHHVQTLPVNQATCGVCHDQSNHMNVDTTNGVSVRLFNQDTGASILYDGTAANNAEAFCASCHDSNGATTQGANALRPFNASGDATAPQNMGWTAGAMAHSASLACFNCHGNSAGATNTAAGTTNSPKFNGHGSATGKMLQFAFNAADTNTSAANFCYNCHGTTTAAPAGTANIQSEFAKTGSIHATPTCNDCHNKHGAKAGAHAIGNNKAGGPLNGIAGASLTANPVFFAAPTAASFTTVTIASGTDPEASLCFRCHSAAKGSALGTSPSGGFTMTDQAQEFNPNNVGNFAGTWATGETAGSFHPVLASAGNNLGAVNLANLVTTSYPWSKTTRNLMTCSDCHGSDTLTDPTGPHGSAASFILKGPNTTWSSSVQLSSTGMPPGTFCANCHAANFSGSRFPAHTNGQHSFPCVICHIIIPHGAQRPGFLHAKAGSAAGVPAAPITDNAPYYNNPSSPFTLYIFSYPTNNATNWQDFNCGCNGTSHN